MRQAYLTAGLPKIHEQVAFGNCPLTILPRRSFSLYELRLKSKRLARRQALSFKRTKDGRVPSLFTSGACFSHSRPQTRQR
jgi:hypothetical protein